MMNIEVGQIVAQIIAFLIMLAVLKRFAWTPLLKLLEDRQKRIQGEFDLIEERKKEVGQLKESYQDKLSQIEAFSKKLAQEAVNKAREQAREIEEEAHRRAREITNKANLSSEEAMVGAEEELKKKLAKLVIAATEAVLQKEVDIETQKELISRYMAELK